MHGYGYYINELGIKRNGEWYDDKRVQYVGPSGADKNEELIMNQFKKKDDFKKEMKELFRASIKENE